MFPHSYNSYNLSSQYSMANSDRKRLIIAGKNDTNLIGKDMVRAKMTAE